MESGEKNNIFNNCTSTYQSQRWWRPTQQPDPQRNSQSSFCISLGSTTVAIHRLAPGNLNGGHVCFLSIPRTISRCCNTTGLLHLLYKEQSGKRTNLRVTGNSRSQLVLFQWDPLLLFFTTSNLAKSYFSYAPHWSLKYHIISISLRFSISMGVAQEHLKVSQYLSLTSLLS